MERFCDLHTHSVHSDGTFTPAEIVAAAVEAELCAVALCDHNTVAGLPEFHAAGAGKPVETVGGVEISTEYLGKDLHIVGLYVMPEHYGGITELMEAANLRKQESVRALCEALKKAGYDPDYEDICARHPGGTINRAIIAAALTQKGYTASIRDAFRTILSEDGGYYTPPRRLDAMEVISELRGMGVVPVLAHPFLDLTEEELELFLSEAKEAGLLGMETLYSCFDQAERECAARIADKFELLPSGGSDFHGANKPDIRLGLGRGDLFVPDSFLHGIRKKKR